MSRGWIGRRSVIGMLGAASALGVSGLAARAQGKQPLKVLLDWTWWPPHIPLVTAKEKGFFDAMGLDVELKQGTGSGTTSQIVGQGVYDIGHVNLSAAAQSIAKGVPLKAIATISAMGPPGLVFREGTIGSPKDLIGKRVGSTPGGSDSQILPAFLAANGIELSQIKLVNMPGEAKLGALLTGQIDALSGDAIYFVALAADKGAKMSHLNYGDHGANTIGYGFIANRERIKSDPERLKLFLPAAMKGYRYVADNLDESIEIYKRTTRSEQSVATIKEVYQGYQKLIDYRSADRGGVFTGRNDPVVWKDTLAILSRYGGLSTTMASSEFWTNELLTG